MREIGSKLGRWTRNLLLVLVPLSVLSCAGLFVPVPPLAALMVVLGAIVGIGWMAWLFILSLLVWWRAFAPRIKTDVFYLRSFRNDPDTWAIRVAIQQAIGHRRLSGIRDPRRRAVSVFENLSPLFLAMKYCTPRYMDLEAGDDWKPRLWNSLHQGEMAVLDLSDVTPFVLEEVRLSCSALGMNRIVCLGRQPQTAAELRAIAAKELGVSPEAGPPHAILWPGGSGQRPGPLELKSFERQFANIVDAIAALPRPEGALQSRQWGQIAPIPRTERKAEILFWRMLKIQIALMSVNLALGLVVGLGISDPDTRSIAMFAVSAPFTLFNMWLLLQNWLVYIYDVGIPSDRWKASVALAFTIFVSVFSIAFGSSRMEATPQAPAPRPLAPQVVEADQRLLAAEDQAEAEYQRDFGRR